MLYTLIIILIVIVCILLTLVVLLQSGQGQGLSGGLAAMGSASQMIGARRTADILSKATGYLGGSLMVLCVLANFFIEGKASRSVIQSAGTTTQAPATPAPAETPSAIPTPDASSSNPVAADSAR
jgi:preprotein translocase subunit SecG